MHVGQSQTYLLMACPGKWGRVMSHGVRWSPQSLESLQSKSATLYNPDMLNDLSVTDICGNPGHSDSHGAAFHFDSAILRTHQFIAGLWSSPLGQCRGPQPQVLHVQPEELPQVLQRGHSGVSTTPTERVGRSSETSDMKALRCVAVWIMLKCTGPECGGMHGSRASSCWCAGCADQDEGLGGGRYQAGLL